VPLGNTWSSAFVPRFFCKSRGAIVRGKNDAPPVRRRRWSRSLD
jgi:hypothetical protein